MKFFQHILEKNSNCVAFTFLIYLYQELHGASKLEDYDTVVNDFTYSVNCHIPTGIKFLLCAGAIQRFVASNFLVDFV